MIRVLVTGGNGFVLAPLVRQILGSEPSTRVAIVDLAPPDDLVRSYFADVRERLDIITGDLCDPTILGRVGTVSHVVHGAAATLDDEHAWADVRPLLDANVGATLEVLNWLENQPAVRRVIHVSSGAVYGDAWTSAPAELDDEAGPLNPRAAYGVTKAAGESLALRFAELHNADIRVARLAGVFGPMERPTATRANMSPVYRLVRAHVLRGHAMVSHRALEASLTLVSSEDVARALTRLLWKNDLQHRAYNVASGRAIRVAELLRVLKEAVQGFAWSLADGAVADLDLPAFGPLARSYAAGRIQNELDWRPRPLAEMLSNYVAWARINPSQRCP